MQLPPSTSSTPASAADTLLRHFPEEVRLCYDRLQASGEPAAADKLVLAILVDHVPNKAAREGLVLKDDMGLVSDLGFDSVAITEMVFFIEDLFRVNISNAEIVRVRTVGDLREFVRSKLAARNLKSRA